jgi:ankyrin repeat protein
MCLCLREYQYSGYSQQFPKYITRLHIVASFGLAKIVQLLLEREGVNAGSRDPKGRTPLSWAAEREHEAVVKLLLEHGDVDANSNYSKGRMLLLRAAE